MSLHTCFLQFQCWEVSFFFCKFQADIPPEHFGLKHSNHEQHSELRPDDDSACVKAVFADGSTWDVSTMTAQQCRFMPARRAQHGKKEANVCWLGEHAVSHHKLAVQFRRERGRTDGQKAMKIVKGNLGNFGESFTQSRRPGTVGGHACSLFELKELADPVQNWKKLPKNPER